MRIGIVALPVAASTSSFGILPNTIELLRCRRAKILTFGRARLRWDVVFFVATINLFLEVGNPSIDCSLGVLKAFTDIFLDLGEFI